MPHAKRLANVVEEVLAQIGLSNVYRVDVYRAHRLDEWHATLHSSSEGHPTLHLQFEIGETPNWHAVAADAKRQIQSPSI